MNAMDLSAVSQRCMVKVDGKVEKNSVTIVWTLDVDVGLTFFVSRE